MGFTNRLTMEGLVFELGEKHRGGKDERRRRQDARQPPRGLPLPRAPEEGRHLRRRRVYKDDNALRLVQNYAAGYIRAGEKLLDQGSLEEASSRPPSRRCS